MASARIFVPATAAPDAGPDVSSQTALTLARLDERLRAERSSLADTAAITIYLRRAEDFAAMNDAYRQAWTGTPPTRTTVVCDLLTTGALVEMSAVAVPAGAQRAPVHPSAWMASPNPYSYGIRAGDTLFLSGLIARNGRDNTLVAGDVATETRAVLENARELLNAVGFDFAHVVSARVFLPDLADFAEMNRVYREYFREAPPARATVGARLTGPAYTVEITLVASAAPRAVIDAGGPRYPNVSPAVLAGPSLYIAGMLAAEPADRRDAGSETRDIVRQLDAVLETAGFGRDHVRDLLIYVTSADAARAAVAVCRETFGHGPCITTVRARLAVPDASVEIMACALRSDD